MLCLVFVVAAAALRFATAEEETSPPPAAPNIILIVLDTVRADHLECYGYDRDTSPAIDAFAGTCDRYTRSFASAPHTLSSHASIFTGLEPYRHGAHRDATGEYSILSMDHTTLAEGLRDAGFVTAGFSANAAFLAPRSRLNQGFETYEYGLARAHEHTRKVLEWLEGRDSLKASKRDPFFLFINYMDAHRPYNCEHRSGFPETPPWQHCEFILNRLMEIVMGKQEDPPPDLHADAVNQYDLGIANLDEQIGFFLERLRERGLYDDSLIIVMSDHGEFFGEHGLIEHGMDVYQEVVWVPLFIKRPAQTKGRVVEEVVSSIDIPAMILAELPDEIAEPLGEQLPRRAPDTAVISESYRPWKRTIGYPLWGRRLDRVRRAIYEWPYKYIHSSDGQHELYNLDDDPREQTNLVTSSPGIAERLRARLSDMVDTESTADAGEAFSLDQEDEEALRRLGYTGK